MTEPRPEPVSWLKLERYHLGELSPEEAAVVERAIAEDPATRECLERIRAPLALNPLPDIPGRVAPVRPLKPKRPSLARSPGLFAALALAAAAVLFITTRPSTDGSPDGGELPPARIRVKGGDVALELVRERAGAVTPAPTTFSPEDRFKVLLTCPPSMDGRFDVVVLQGREAFFPLDTNAPVACGNRVPLAGAFALDGAEPATVCATWSASPSTRADLAQRGIAAIRSASVCTTLKPER